MLCQALSGKGEAAPDSLCVCVSFVSAEHLNIVSIGPTRFVSHVKTARVTSSPVSITDGGGIKTAPDTCAALETELLSDTHCRTMHVASVAAWTF